MRSARWFGLTLAFILGCLPAMALPTIGTPAPPLDFTQLLQAPAGAKADWTTLRGKVVVLEFWATWCGPCIAEIPHLNELASSVDPGKVQFISVDDESPKVLQAFLAKRRMAGWVGIDTTGAVFKRYGVTARPTTIIVNGQGRILAITYPEFIKAADLEAVAAGKPVTFRAAIVPILTPNMAASGQHAAPLFEISISRAKPGSRMEMGASSEGITFSAAKPDFLLPFIYDVPEDRLVWQEAVPTDAYDMTMISGGMDRESLTPLLQAAVAAALHLHVKPTQVTEAAYVLTATPAAKKLLTPTASTGGSMAFANDGQVNIINGSLDDFARQMENDLHLPVLNETGIQGKYDIELTLPQKGPDAAAEVILKKLGLDLHKERRTITVLKIERETEEKPSTPATP